MSLELRQIAELAAKDKNMVFTTLAHLIDVKLLNHSYNMLRKDAASGVDEQTAEEYAENLVTNVKDLHERLKQKRYRALPVKRVWIDKDDGKKRPIGITTFEDKIVQRAAVTILEQVYEQDFYEFSQGYRRGKGAHKALQMLREFCTNHTVTAIIDADISGCFDNLDHQVLYELLHRRVKDGGIDRLIGKWLNAGVIDGKEMYFADKGTPQGAVVTPPTQKITWFWRSG